MYTKDEKAAHKATKSYSKAIKTYKLDQIEDGWGNDTKRYMMDAFYAGFYSGRDYLKRRIFKLEEEYLDSLDKEMTEEIKIIFNRLIEGD